MIRLTNGISARDAERVFLEPLVSELASVLTGVAFSAVWRGDVKDGDCPHGTGVFSFAECGEDQTCFSLSIHNAALPTKRRHFAMLSRLLAGAWDRKLAGYRVVERDLAGIDGELATYELSGNSQRALGVAVVCVRSKWRPAVIGRECGQSHNATSIGGKASLQMMITGAEARAALSGSHTLSLPGRMAFLEVAGSVYPCSLRADRSGRCVGVMEEGVMSGDDIQVTLDLGSIELPLADLVRLRPGMTVEFERPAAFEGTIQVAGTPWATVQIGIGADGVSLLVERVFCTDSRVKETFA